jgi:N-acetylglucosamine-6-phosphate deacetylase
VNGLIVPGFIDLHVHGGAGADFMDGTVEARSGSRNFMRRKARRRWRQPRCREPQDAVLRAVDAIAQTRPRDQRVPRRSWRSIWRVRT